MTNVNLPLEVDLQGRVANMRLAPANTLYALYEAVVNSIHAILDLPEGERSSGRVTIRILHGAGQQRTTGSKAVGPVIGFQIEDNGVGFNEQNFTSFRRSDSTTKAKFGGKGVGRLNWLRVFQSIQIASVFKEGVEAQERQFTFSTQGIGSQSLSPSTNPRATIVTMKSPFESYRDALQHEPETIARSTIEHCLEYLLTTPRPLVFLLDDELGFSAELGRLFDEDLKSEIRRDTFTVGNFTFTIDLPPPSGSTLKVRIPNRGGVSWRGRSTRPSRSFRSCVRQRSCWRRVSPWGPRARRSRSPSRPIIAGARNTAA